MSVTQMEQTKEEDQTILEERSSRQINSGRRNPPARNTSRFWFERFLAVIQRQNPSVIDSSFLTQIAPSNEGKLLAQLKFLHVIDEQGKPTQLLPLLNMVGEDQKKGFQTIAKESYSDLFSELKVDKSVANDLINFFIRKYAFTRDKAVNASKFFLYLAEKGAIPVSSELGSFLSEKPSTTATNGSGVSSSPPRAQERIAKSQPRETRGVITSVPRRSARAMDLDQKPAIQATINIRLDKDTPKEYWDRVLAILGEKKDYVETHVSINGVEQEQSEADQLKENSETTTE